MTDIIENPVVTLYPVNLHWIEGTADEPADLCAHGQVDFRLGNDILVDSGTCPKVTVSAAAMYLLRTLSRAHTKQEPVGDALFPCCGHAMWDVDGEQDVVLQGCGAGVDFEILHAPEEPRCAIRSDAGAWRLQSSAWQAAVFQFADRVSAFYATSSPKRPSADDAAGFRKFVAEWERRRGLPLLLRVP